MIFTRQALAETMVQAHHLAAALVRPTTAADRTAVMDLQEAERAAVVHT